MYSVQIGDGQGRDRGEMGSTLYAASKMKCGFDSGKSFKLFHSIHLCNTDTDVSAVFKI